MTDEKRADGEAVLSSAGLGVHPCQTEGGESDHDWEFQDESFDHEFGRQQVHFWTCTRCDATRDMEDSDYDDDY